MDRSMDGSMDGWMGGWLIIRTEVRTDGWMDGKMNERVWKIPILFYSNRKPQLAPVNVRSPIKKAIAQNKVQLFAQFLSKKDIIKYQSL